MSFRGACLEKLAVGKIRCRNLCLKQAARNFDLASTYLALYTNLFQNRNSNINSEICQSIRDTRA
jgi:hypothetical protein